MTVNVVMFGSGKNEAGVSTGVTVADSMADVTAMLVFPIEPTSLAKVVGNVMLGTGTAVVAATAEEENVESMPIK